MRGSYVVILNHHPFMNEVENGIYVTATYGVKYKVMTVTAIMHQEISRSMPLLSVCIAKMEQEDAVFIF